MIYSIACQATYNAIELALLANDSPVDFLAIDKKLANAALLPTLITTLENRNLTLADISFFTVNRGPAPFTTLRVLIATINGINFATNIPLIGIDGIKALLQEHTHQEISQKVAILQAFNGDLYYCLQKNGEFIKSGCTNYATVFTIIKQEFPDQPIYCMGNGASLYTQELKNFFGERIVIPQDVPNVVSIQYLGIVGWQQWQQGAISNSPIVPLYLKHTIS